MNHLSMACGSESRLHGKPGPLAAGRGRRRYASWVTRFVCGLATILLTGALRAEPPTRTIVLTFDAASETQKQAITAIRAHVSDLAVEVVTVSAARDDGLDHRLAASGTLAATRHALGTFGIDVAEDGSLLIFFTEADGETMLIRRLPPKREGSRVTLEHAAIVVRSLVEALLDGGNIGIAPGAGRSFGPKSKEVTPNTVPGAQPTVPVLSDRSTSARADRRTEAHAVSQRPVVTAGYTTTEFASEVAWQSGFSAGAHWLVTPTLYAGARYTFFPDLTYATTDAVVLIGRHPLELLVGYRETGRVGLNAEIGVVADRVTRTTIRTAEALRATAPDARWLLAVAARGGFSWSPWSPLRASMRFGADLALMKYAYAIDPGEPLVFPSWIRPRMELELAARLW